MKLRIMLLIGMAAAGVAASYALADGHGNGRDAYASTGAQCQRVHVLGTVPAQELTVTVTRAGKESSLAPGDTVTVALGSTGQNVRVNVEGCLATGTTVTGTTVTGEAAVLHVLPADPQQTTTTDSQVHRQHGGDEHHSTTTTTTTDSTQSPTPPTSNP